ncbi:MULTISPECIES: helix-turn-helix transcriptional regulator [unclassified Streptomyces]|uniref:helix-turn-helix domain-containing protein n=1 Tax=unclassified Streptomyces TaxID=2593676 RepID=UPI0029B8C427|nr:MULTISPECIES: helix-turn-helix transcriptional regulator [unclassified Streptomyces]MDX3771973.1 helix-turn-helix transcriptional regulator [Streptomyces sp. AK08-01B]MDX3821482.1 helix-turn-helix transcriptional regulator [Streptomyces sp. AK08-01A]
MTISPSSSAQAAREVVARRLRDLRKGAGFTVVELADGCGWHHAKTSRIENARTAPSATDIRLWCRTIGAEDQAEDLIAQSLHAESMYTEWRHQVRNGLKQLQDSAVTFFHQTQLFRVYSSSLVPGLLQTEGYAAAVLGISARFRELPTDDSAEAARARVERSRIVHEAGHRFVLLVEEAVLHYRIGDSDAMAAQLGYLLTAGALPAVSLGIIPATASRSQWPRETFHVYDDSLVSVELVSAQVRITQPSEIALYLKAFEQMRQTAVYGAEARALIVKAIDALA